MTKQVVIREGADYIIARNNTGLAATACLGRRMVGRASGARRTGLKNMEWLIKTICSSIGQKCIMALSGAMLGIFLIVHLLGNSMMFFGRNAFLAYAEHLHAYTTLLPILEAGLLVLFLTHVITATLLFCQNYQSRPERYAVRTNHGGRTWGSRTMAYTGGAILLFLAVHLATFNNPGQTMNSADVVRTVLSQPSQTLFYILAILALTLHISHGFWSMFQTLGLNHPKYNTLIRAGRMAATVLIATVFTLIAGLAFIYDQFLL